MRKCLLETAAWFDAGLKIYRRQTITQGAVTANRVRTLMRQEEISIEKSSEFLRLALPFMSRYRVPVTPQNYAVWYEYVAGTNMPLKEAIEFHIEGLKAEGLPVPPPSTRSAKK